MPTSGSLGIPYLFQYPGDPTGVSTDIFNAPAGSLVIDTTGGPLRTKTSALNDNSGFTEGGALNITASVPISGDTLTYNTVGNSEFLVLSPAGVLATLTLTFPTNANSVVGQIIGVVSTQNITSLTVSSAGLTLTGPSITALTAKTPVFWQKISASNWVRVNIVDGASLASLTSGADLTALASNITFAKESARAISVANSTTATAAGGALTITGAAGVTTGAGGAITITSGAGGKDRKSVV